MKPPPEPLASGEIPMPTCCYVYRMFDAHNELLYVGVTENLCQRIAKHWVEQPWRHQIARITWEEYATREDALYAERYLIRHLYPQYNIAENGRRVAAERMGHRRLYDADAWVRLGSVIRDARTEMRWPQKAIAADARVTVQDYRSLERGESTQYDKVFLDAIECVLCWHPGSIESVLAGGEPSRLSEEELQQRAFAEHARLSLGERI